MARQRTAQCEGQRAIRPSALRRLPHTGVIVTEVVVADRSQLKQTLLERDQEISSLQHKLSLAEEELEKTEGKVKELKGAAEEGDTHRTAGENLARKVQLLEEELDKAEKDLKETTEKLRQVDVKAEHFERAVQRAEQERDDWEKKHGVSVMRGGCREARARSRPCSRPLLV